MKKQKLISCILVFLIIILVKTNNTYASKQRCFDYDTPQIFKTFNKASFSTSKTLYCGEIADSFEWSKDHTFRLADGGHIRDATGKIISSTKYYWEFRSDDDNQTDRKMAWLAKYLVDGINGTKPAKGYAAYYKLREDTYKQTNNYDTARKVAKANTWQGAFWLWQKDGKENGSETTKTFLNLCFPNASTNLDYSSNWIWSQANNDSAKKITYSTGTPKITTNQLVMEDQTGSFKVNTLWGSITEMTFECRDGTKYTIPYDHSEPYQEDTQLNQEILLFKDSDYDSKSGNRLLVGNIKKGTTVYVKNNTDKIISKVRFKVKNKGSGFAAKVIAYYDDTTGQNTQNLATVELLRNTEEKEEEFTMIPILASGKITVRKIDYDNNTLINGSKFVIFGTNVKNGKDGWIGYNETSNNITTANSWKNAYYFETGKGYTFQKAYDGEFTIDYLPYGRYYLFEVETGSNEYSLKGQPGYNATSNYKFIKDTNKPEWKMLDENGNGIESVLIGNSSAQAGFTGVCFADGSQYQFIPHKYENGTNASKCDFVRMKNFDSIGPKTKIDDKYGYYYGTKHATYTVRNKKNTKLTILKKDKLTNKPIENVGIKILVQTKEKRYTLNSFKWLKSNGTVTDSVNNAYEFKTDKDGKIEIENVPYGIYYIYETSTPSDKYQLEMQDHYMGGKPKSYKGDFLSGEYAYLGSKSLMPNTNNDITSDNYTSEVIENGTYQISSNINKAYGMKRTKYNSEEWDIKFGKIIADDAFYFRIAYVDHGNYLILAKNGSVYWPITIEDNTISVKGNVIGTEYEGTNYQMWKFKKVSTNVYNIVSGANSNYGLHIEASKQNIIDKNKIEGVGINIYNNLTLDTLKFNLIKSLANAQVDINGSREITIETTNNSTKPKSYKLTIEKKDESYNQDLNQNEILRLKGAEIKIFGTSLDEGEANSGWIKEIKLDDDNIIYTYSYYEDATTFTIGDTGKIEIDGLLSGDYYIYETKTPTGYPPKEQPGYHMQSEGSADLGDDDWVFLGSQTINDDNYDAKYTASNIRYVSGGIKGKVWIDNPDGKANNINNIYDNDSNDKLLDTPITVNLYSNKDGKNELIANTTTNQNGEYEFKTKANGEKFTYWELAYCYVEFVYDNEEYITVVPFEGENLEINSKAQEKEINSTGGENNMGELYDGNLSGLDPNGDYPGKAITYQANISEINLDTIKNNQNAPQNQRLLTSYYNSDTYTIENINLGLIKKIEPSFSVGQQIEYVIIKRGNYTFKYNYNMRR